MENIALRTFVCATLISLSTGCGTNAEPLDDPNVGKTNHREPIRNEDNQPSNVLHQQSVPRPGSLIKDSFSKLKTALLESDGPTAVQYVTDSTIAMYERSVIYALESSEVDFEEVDLLQVLLTFSLRYLLDAESLEGMDGRSAFMWGVENGLVKKQILLPFEIDTVQFEGSTAFAIVKRGGETVNDAIFRFKMENGKWKLDLADISEKGSIELDRIRKDAGKTKVEMAMLLLQRTYSSPIPASILAGPIGPNPHPTP